MDPGTKPVPPAVVPDSAPAPPYRQTAAEVAAALGTDPRLGLSEEEARALLARYGRNELAAEAPVPAWRRFLAQFQDVLVVLLLIATAISAALWYLERDDEGDAGARIDGNGAR
jgi:P-type Ca2+ transporter type 2C